MAMTSSYPFGHKLMQTSFSCDPSSSVDSNNRFSCGSVPSDSLKTEGSISAARQPFLHPTKRHMGDSNCDPFDEDEPKAKRKVDRMNARFRNFHISQVQNPHHETWQRKQKLESFADIENRLSDSSDEEREMKGDCSYKKEKMYSSDDVDRCLHLSELLREYLKRSREYPSIIVNPSDKALVPYIPQNPLDDPSMRGRITEISNEEAERFYADRKGDMTISSPFIEDFLEEFKPDEQEVPVSRESTPLSFIELPEDSEFDMDIDFE